MEVITNLCDNNQIKDEFYYLLECKALASIRKEKPYVPCPTKFYKFCDL